MVTARDVMTPTTGFLGEADSVAAAATMMRDLDVSSVPVCDQHGHLAGVLTDRDIVVRCLAVGRDPYATTTRDLVDDHTLAVSVDEPLESALVTMATHHVRRLPVVEHGNLVGMLADTDVAQSIPDDALGLLFARRGA
jgi:CBS domain-containing protein